MYLVLLEHSYMSPDEFQQLIKQYDADADIVHSSSAETLLKIAEKASPEIIIIDFDLVKDQSTAYFETLREQNQEAYIFALIGHDDYDRILMVIEYGGIDGYLVKPIKNEELMARLHIAKRKKGLTAQKQNEQTTQREDESPAETILPEDSIEPVSDGRFIEQGSEVYSNQNQKEASEIEASEIEVPEIVAPEIEVPEVEPPSEEDVLGYDENDQFGQDIPGPRSEEIEGDRFISNESIDDYIVENLSSETAEHFPAIENLIKPEEKEDSFGSLFDDISFDNQPVPAEKEVKPSEEIDLSEPKFVSQPDDVPEKQYKTQSEIDDAVVRPAREFIKQPEEKSPDNMPGPDISLPSSLPGNSAEEFLLNDDGFSAEEFTRSEESMLSTRKSSKKRKAGGGGFLRFLSIIGNFVFIFLLIAMAIMAFFLVQGRLSGEVPQVAGYKLYIVLSGSMSPEFEAGSLAFVRDVEPAQIAAGDIITFRSQVDPDSLVSHRVVGVISEGGLQFITRGDASSINDPSPVPAENVIGRVTGSVPYLGALMSFVQTRQGIIMMIFVPGIIIIAFELTKIIKYLSKDKDSKKRKRGKKKKYPVEESQL